MLTLIALNTAALFLQIDSPVREWNEPGMHLSVAHHTVNIRGHVASQSHTDRLLIETGSNTQAEFWRHILLPANWERLSVELVSIARQMQSGEATLSRDVIRLTGLVAEQTEIQQQLQDFEQSLPPGWSLELDVQTLSAAARRQACDQLHDALPRVLIFFDRNSSSIRGSYIAHLNRVADFMQRCPSFQLIATGHSDGVGAVKSRLLVSQQRADAITDYLNSLGVTAERMTGIGKGEAAPVASNATWEGRNQNRRVELELYSVALSSVEASSSGP